MFNAPLCLDALMQKISGTKIPEVKKVALAYSGGLDSSLGIELLKRVYHAKEVIPILVDIGQGKEEMEKAVETAKCLGIDPLIISAKEEFSQIWLKKAIHANSNYQGYPVSTSMTRQLIAKIIAKKAVELECDAVMEGSTGKGNDQYRMHNVFVTFAPHLEILVPVRDFDLTRDEEMFLAKEWKIPLNEEIVGGDDKTLWARSIASGAIDLNDAIPDHVWMWKKPLCQTPDIEDEVILTFEKGIPTKLNGKELTLDVLISNLNEIGGNHGIGGIDICEDRIMGLKSREIYEAPAAHIILKVHKDLESFCLSKQEILFKPMIDAKWSELVYHGLWFHPLKKALDGFIEKTQGVVNGTYTLSLFKGSVVILKRDLPTSLLDSDLRSISTSHFNQKLSKDTAYVMGLPLKVMSKRGGYEAVE